jgi:hypothetical protein
MGSLLGLQLPKFSASHARAGISQTQKQKVLRLDLKSFCPVLRVGLSPRIGWATGANNAVSHPESHGPVAVPHSAFSQSSSPRGARSGKDHRQFVFEIASKKDRNVCVCVPHRELSKSHALKNVETSL